VRPENKKRDPCPRDAIRPRISSHSRVADTPLWASNPQRHIDQAYTLRGLEGALREDLEHLRFGARHYLTWHRRSRARCRA
jgi:hypothetical protein